ncbi:MAG: CmpA/NrtA family ABC transporter substrate-binding protein [Pseudomonadota bacterium]
MSVDVHLGFVPLTDAAPLIIAREMGIAEEEGINLTLHKEVSWANIRDKVGFGIYNGAHMLSPMPIAMAMGLGPMKSRQIVPMVLSQNGNGLALKPTLAAEICPNATGVNDPRLIGDALVAAGKKKTLRIGVPFMQSMHVALMRYLVEKSGGTVGEHIRFFVAPPSLMNEVLRADEVDGFMVGAPYFSRAIDHGLAELVLLGAAIWKGAPEKVLALDAPWAEENLDATLGLVRAIYKAQSWADQNKETGALAELLSKPQYLDASATRIEGVLCGQIQRNQSGAVIHDPLAIRFAPSDVSFPWRSQAQWIAAQEAPGWGILGPKAAEIAESCFRPDIFRQAISKLGAPLPTANAKVEGALEQRRRVPSDKELFLGPDFFFDLTQFEPSGVV